MLKPSIIPWYPLSMRISSLTSVKSPRFIAVVSLVIAGREHPRAQLARHQRFGAKITNSWRRPLILRNQKGNEIQKKKLRIRQLSKFPGCILIRKSKNPSLGVMKTVPYRKLRAVCRMCMCYIHIYIYILLYIYHVTLYYMRNYVDIDLERRKFRSQTSDNMGRWKSRGEKSQKREEQKREDQRRERVRSQKMQVREKVEKSRNTLFSQWFVAPEGRKVGSLKWRARKHVVR